MIKKNLFNFKRDKEKAADYRVSLKNSSYTDDMQKLESLIFARVNRYKDIKFFDTKLNQVLKSNDFSFVYKQFMFYIFYTSKVLKKTKNKIIFFENKTNLYLKKLNKDLKNLNSLVKASDIKLNTKYNKIKIFSLFKEKDFKESYDLIDNKRNLILSNNMQSSYKDDCISAPLKLNHNINIVSIEICEELTYGSDNLYQLDVTKDTSFLYREGKVFNYIVGKNEFNETGQIKKDRDVSLTLILHFSGYQDINNLFIESSSALHINYDLNNLFYNNENDEWVNIPNVGEYNFYNRTQLYFSRVHTNKIRVKLFQKKYYDTAFISDQNSKERNDDLFLKKSFINLNPVIKKQKLNKIYDLSIKKIAALRKVYKGFGFYRESDVVFVNKPLSFVIKEDYLLNVENSFVEKEAHIVLYGEKDFKAFKKSLKNYNQTPRLNEIVSLSNNLTYENEILIFNDYKSNLKLYPSTSKANKRLNDIIKIYKNEELLLLSNDYSISFDNGLSFITENVEIKEIEKQYPEKIAGNVLVKLMYDQSVKDIYRCEYIKDTDFFLNESKLISYSNNEIVFNENLRESVGFIRARFIFRNLNQNNESSLIKEYRVLVEEIDTNDSNYIEYEDFLEIESKGIKNVIQ